jgi:acyl-CoA reductase-like NAD-dependent aldehyde dehydrogenase
MTFDAFWPPQLADLGTTEHSIEGGRALRVPELTSDDVRRLCESLTTRTSELRTYSAAQLCRAIGAAAASLTNSNHPLHQLALEWIPSTTGYSPAMTQEVLERMARDWSELALLELLSTELGDPARLDGFLRDEQTNRASMAIGPRITGHIFSGNVPGVAVTSLVRALLVKSASFGKMASAEPVLPVLFARALAEVDPKIAKALVLTWWPGGTEELDCTLVEQCDAVVVYGGAEAIDSARRYARSDTKLVLHGPKLSLGLIGPEAPNTQVAKDAARAVAMFDQQGCVSPHVIYIVAEKRAAAEFARSLASELRALAADLPRGRLRTEEAVAIQQARAAAEFRAIGGSEIELHADDNLAFTVVYDATPAFEASCLNRFVYVKPLAAARALAQLLEPFAALLQSVAIEGFTPEETNDLAIALARRGVTRITTFAALPWPAADWHHDGGAGPIRELVTWCDLEN